MIVFTIKDSKNSLLMVLKSLAPYAVPIFTFTAPAKPIVTELKKILYQELPTLMPATTAGFVSFLKKAKVELLTDDKIKKLSK